jgi:hypothetical protein
MGKFRVGIGIAKKGLGLLGKRIKRPGMSKEDKIKTGAVAATGAAITGLGVLKAKSEIDKDYGVTKKPKDKTKEDKK